MHVLKEYEEAVGVLEKIEAAAESGVVEACFPGFKVVLPTRYAEALEDMRGKKVGILRTDIPGKEYLFRVMEDED